MKQIKTPYDTLMIYKDAMEVFLIFYPYVFDSVFLSPSIGHRKSNKSYFFF